MYHQALHLPRSCLRTILARHHLKTSCSYAPGHIIYKPLQTQSIPGKMWNSTMTILSHGNLSSHSAWKANYPKSSSTEMPTNDTSMNHNNTVIHAVHVVQQEQLKPHIEHHILMTTTAFENNNVEPRIQRGSRERMSAAHSVLGVLLSYRFYILVSSFTATHRKAVHPPKTSMEEYVTDPRRLYWLPRSILFMFPLREPPRAGTIPHLTTSILQSTKQTILPSKASRNKYSKPKQSYPLVAAVHYKQTINKVANRGSRSYPEWHHRVLV